MKTLQILFLLISGFGLFAQENSKELVKFGDLKFHSPFEKKSISNYIDNQADTFNLFMSVDPLIEDNQANGCYLNFQFTTDNIANKTRRNKNLKKRINQVFSLVHESFLRRYNEIEYFPQVFMSGTYNCVSSSILYALVFNKLGIKYRIYYTSNHVYLVANPGTESIIIETTDPSLDWEIFTSEYKRNYINNMKALKIIDGNELSSKSVDEIFHSRYYKANPAIFDNLIGFQYYNKGILYLKENKPAEAYINLQKAYFFFPSQQVKQLLYSALELQIQKCTFRELSDIDYLVQYARFEETDHNTFIKIYGEIINFYLEFTDKVFFCDSLHERLTSGIHDAELLNELNFSYHLKMAKHHSNTAKITPYIEKAISIKQNHLEANKLFTESLEKRLDRITTYKELTDSIIYLKQKYKYDFVSQLLDDYQLIAYLQEAYNYFRYNKISEGEHMLMLFEKSCSGQVETNRTKLIRSIETTYRTLAMYYFYRNQKMKAQEIVERGLKFVPGSRYIQSAVY